MSHKKINNVSPVTVTWQPTCLSLSVLAVTQPAEWTKDSEDPCERWTNTSRLLHRSRAVTWHMNNSNLETHSWELWTNRFCFLCRRSPCSCRVTRERKSPRLFTHAWKWTNYSLRLLVPPKSYTRLGQMNETFFERCNTNSPLLKQTAAHQVESSR